jgi:hypothetical protein
MTTLALTRKRTTSLFIKARGMCGNSVSSDLSRKHDSCERQMLQVGHCPPTALAPLVALFHYRLGVTRYHVVLQSTFVQAIMNCYLSPLRVRQFPTAGNPPKPFGQAAPTGLDSPVRIMFCSVEPPFRG